MISTSLLMLALWIQPAAPPSNQPAAYGLYLEALSLKEDNKNDEALKVLQKALKADPKAADVHAEIARIQLEESRFDLAVTAVDQAIRISPRRADLRSLAGQIHQFHGQSGGGEAALRLAAKEYETASSIDPMDPAPLRDLTRLYSVLRDAKAALDTWKRLAVADPRNVDAFIQVANLSFNTGDTEGAVEALQTAAKADPQNARVLQLLGDIKQQSGKAEEALAHYEAAAKIDDKDLITRLKIGEILIDSHRGAEALKMADEMLEEDKANRFGLDLKARALKELDRIDEAIQVAEGLSNSDPKDLKAAFLVVTLLEQKGALQQADEKLTALLSRNTSKEDAESIARNNRVFWAHAGMVRQRLGRFQEAADAFGQAANAGKEKDPSLVTYRIDALISARQFDKALQEARAAKLDPAFKEEGDLKFLEAYALRGTGDEKGASALVEKNLAAASSKDEVSEMLSAAEFYQRGKQLARAQQLFTQVAEKDPKNVRAFFSLGSVLERQKKFDEAEKAFRKALDLSPDSAITLNYLGYMNADRNVRVDEALTLIEKALAKDPENGSYLDSLAWALHRLGRHGEAEVAIRKAIATQDKNAVVIAHMGLILAAKGDHAEALKFLRLSLDGEDEDGELDRALVEERIRALSQAAQKKP
jgi:tetratricopeptide (TPR) repeat protein